MKSWRGGRGRLGDGAEAGVGKEEEGYYGGVSEREVPTIKRHNGRGTYENVLWRMVSQKRKRPSPKSREKIPPLLYQKNNLQKRVNRAFKKMF